MALKLETHTIRTMATFEKITKTHAKDCIISESVVYFVVEPKKMGLAIGKNGANINSLRRILEKNIRIFSDAGNAEDFIRGIVPEAKSIKESENVLNVSINPQDRSLIIGRNGETIRAIRELLKRHYNISDVRLKM